MYMSGVTGIVGGVWLINRLRDIPQSLGLPPIEKHNNDFSQTSEEELDRTAGQTLPKKVLLDYVLKNPWVWSMSIAYFFVYVIRTGFNDWTNLFLQETKGYELLAANAGIFWFELGGVAGTLVAGLGSDSLFKGKRMPVIIGYALALIIVTPMLWYIPPGYMALDYTVLTVIGFLIFGPQMLIGLAVAEYVDKRAACTANGFAGLLASIGAAFASYALGIVIDIWGWYSYLLALIISSVIILLISIKVASKSDKRTVMPLVWSTENPV